MADSEAQQQMRYTTQILSTPQHPNHTPLIIPQRGRLVLIVQDIVNEDTIEANG
jgi:hypothetical protein